MQESLEQHASTLKATQRWWVVVIEGIVAIVIGLFIVAFPANASDAIRTLIAIALLVVSLGQIVEGFRFRNRPGSPWATLLGGRLDLMARHHPQYNGAHFRLTIPTQQTGSK